MLNHGIVFAPTAERVSRQRKLSRWVERGALFLLIACLGFHFLPRAWNSLITDFPNSYMSARLVHEGYDTSRMYEWKWLQREKDHRAVGVRVIGLVPITPFSTLALWPLAGLAPLTAKHIWILLSIALLLPISWTLRSMTGLSYQRIGLIFALSFPLYRNLEYGQFYVLLLLLIVAACWSWLRGFWALAGALVAVAAACKIFPVLFFIFFLRRRAWRSVAWGAVAGAAAAAVSVAVFGWNVHRTYLLEILPWNLHGDVMQPYAISSSISGILHSLFLSEPQWNPHPWHSSPLCYAVLLPALQMLVLAPAILLVRRDSTRNRVLLEWSALLTASLAISTVPASYELVLMALPMCVLAATLLQRGRFGWLAVLVVAYIGVGFPVPIPRSTTGLAVLLYAPRLPLTLGVLTGIYALLWREQPSNASARDWTRFAWAAALILFVAFNARATFLRESGMRREYAYRLPLPRQGYLNADPQSDGAGVRYIAFTLGGYHLVTSGEGGTSAETGSSGDILSFSGGGPGHLWVEQGGSPHSKIDDLRNSPGPAIEDARDPMLSADRRSLAFVRDHNGRGRLMMRATEQSAAEVVLTPPSLNVYEASFLSAKEYAFSAVEGRRPPRIYLTDAAHENVMLALGESRYPALSPDGRWMAYSGFEHGVWNLWLRDERTGAIGRIANVPCNQIQPSWEADSKTLLYSTDCGRSLWFTAVARRKVAP